MLQTTEKNNLHDSPTYRAWKMYDRIVILRDGTKHIISRNFKFRKFSNDRLRLQVILHIKLEVE